MAAISQSATTLIVIRHGETEWNRERRLMNHLDSPLSAVGREQTRRLAERMRTVEFDELVSSDLGRAQTTAAEIASRTERAVTAYPELRERALGIFEGKTWSEIGQDFPEELYRYREDPDYEVPGGESARQYQERTIGFLSALAARHSGKVVAVVAHGGTLGCLIRHVMNLPIHGPQPARLLNVSLNVFEVEGDLWRLRTWGDIAHLDGLD